jgi:hypothetical protein
MRLLDDAIGGVVVPLQKDCLAIARLSFGNPSVASKKEAGWQDGQLACRSRIGFDLSKFDDTKLHATCDVLFVSDFSGDISADMGLARKGQTRGEHMCA